MVEGMENRTRTTDRTGRDELHTEPAIGDLASITTARTPTQKVRDSRPTAEKYNRIALWAAIDAALILFIVYLYKAFVIPLMLR
jgi:hypothetical protein